MNAQELIDPAKALVAGDKGLLAMAPPVTQAAPALVHIKPRHRQFGEALKAGKVGIGRSRAHLYRRHSWGPKEADALIATDGVWHNPRPAETIS
jgi:hypothetical protein